MAVFGVAFLGSRLSSEYNDTDEPPFASNDRMSRKELSIEDT